MAGTKELTEVLGFGIALGNSLGKVFEDGKFSLTELTEFITPVVKLPSALDGIGQVKEELADLDETEMVELKDFVKTNFDIPEDKIEEVIERAVSAVMELLPLINLFRTPPEEVTNA